MKRFLAVLTALTILVSCSFTAMANPVPGGVYGDPLVVENVTLDDLIDSNSAIEEVDGKFVITPDQGFESYSTKNIDYDTLVEGYAWKNTGAVEIGYDLTYCGTINAPDFFTLGIGMTAFNSSNKRDWIIGGPNANTDFTFTDGGTKNIKWVVEWTDTQLIAKHYNKRPEETNWTYVKTVIKDWQPDANYRKLRDIHIYGQYNYFNGKTEPGSAYAIVENYYMKEIYPSTYLSVPEATLDASTQNADIEYVLNTNYKKAVLTVGGVVAEELNCDTTPSGSYVTTFDLSDLTYTGTVPVELTVTDKNGNVTKATDSIATVSPMERELIAYNDFDGNEGCTYGTLSYTATHVTSGGKSGNGISVTNIPEKISEEYAEATGGSNNAIQINNINNPDGYVYDIEFDIYQIDAVGNQGGKSGVIVKNYYLNDAGKYVSDWKTGGWNYIQNHTQMNGVSGKYPLGEWVSLKYTINTANDTLSAYNLETGELLGTNSYVNDGINYFGLGYVVYSAVPAMMKIDNVKFYRYLPGSKAGVEAVSADALTKTVTVTLDTAFDAAAVDSGVTLKVGEDTVAATVAPQTDGKTLVITPDIADTLKGKNAVVAIDASVVGSAMEIPVTFPEDYFNRKITENASTKAVTVSADVVSYEAGTDAGIMYLAFYKNGNLAEVSKTELATTKVGVETLSYTYTPTEAYDDIRVFVWDAYKNPLLKK